MTYTVMAYVVMAYVVVSCVAMACIAMAYILMAYMVVSYVAMACIAMAYLAVGHIAMTYTVMAYTVMAYNHVLDISLWPLWLCSVYTFGICMEGCSSASTVLVRVDKELLCHDDHSVGSQAQANDRDLRSNPRGQHYLRPFAGPMLFRPTLLRPALRYASRVRTYLEATLLETTTT